MTCGAAFAARCATVHPYREQSGVVWVGRGVARSRNRLKPRKPERPACIGANPMPTRAGTPGPQPVLHRGRDRVGQVRNAAPEPDAATNTGDPACLNCSSDQFGFDSIRGGESGMRYPATRGVYYLAVTEKIPETDRGTVLGFCFVR
tara:strand:- start:27 stop:467 length:441 start_codon:yes stop_codon:yes gene_type:complete